MTALTRLQKIQAKNRSMICLGLDLDNKKMPAAYTRDTKGMFDFAQQIIKATAAVVCAYKPNLAFFESLGAEGWSLLKLIVERIPEEVPIILDAKRGDIGNTAAKYAEALYDRLHASWVTVNPYMGYDSIRPFIEYKDHGVFILCLTSNPGSRDFQMLMVDGKPLYRIVAEKVASWNKEQNCGLVVGATQPEQIEEIRQVAEEMPLLIPGVGAQGGSLEKSATLGTDNFRKTALINVSRSVLYASNGEDFADRARQEILKLNSQVDALRPVRNDHDHDRNQQNSESQPAAPAAEAPTSPPAQQPEGNQSSR